MRIKKHSIQNLVETISLSEHLKRYLELKGSGGNWLGICPFHQDSTPSFYVYPNNYHCFSCNAHGSVIDYEIHRTGLSFKESVEQLAQLYNHPLEYESSEFDEKNKQLLQIQNEQISVLKKIAVNQVLSQDLKIINSFYYDPPELKEKISDLSQFKSMHPLIKENGDIYGYIFLNSNFKSPQFLTINKNLMPCLNWNEARPYAIREKQLIITFDILDLKLFQEKNIHNVVSCIKEIDINLLKLFGRRVKKLILIIPEYQEGKLFLWQTFQNCINYVDVSVDVLMTHENREKRNLFFTAMSEEKIKTWLHSSEKIHIKVTQLFLDSLTKEKNKLLCFKEKILPVINQIKELSTKKSLLVDISNRFFYSVDIVAPIIPYSVLPVIPSAVPVVVARDNSRAIIPSVVRDDKHDELIELTSRTIEFYHKYLLQNKNQNRNEPLIYLEARGLTEADIKHWKIGYCSSNQDLSKKAQTGLVSQENLSILGIIKKQKSGNNFYDFFHDRIIIPISNHKGEFVALSGRTFLSTELMPKYINSPESEIFSKSKILFNFYRALDAIIINKYVIIVEGYMDCISLVNTGLENVVAVMGTALTKFHLEELSKLTKRIVLCFDNDRAGQSAAKRTFAAAVSFQNVDLEYLVLPDCKDPDEYIKRFGKDEFLNIAKNKNTLLYEKICEWCHIDSHDYQEFTVNIQKEFSCLIESNNEILTNQVEIYIFDKFNISLTSFFSKNRLSKSLLESKTLTPLILVEQEFGFDWPVKNPLEVKLLLSLLYLKFSELPEILQNIMLDSLSINENDEKICAQAIENQFSKTGFRVFLEISSWMLENRHVSVNYVGSDVFELFSQEAQILIGFSLSDIKILMRYNLHELIKDNLSSGISMVLSANVWNLKNAGFLKFLHRNINLAFQNGVLPSLFAEALLNLEVDYIDSTLKAHSSLHFDNDLDAQFQFLVAERVRCKTKLGKIGSI